MDFPLEKNNYENFLVERDFALHISILVFLRRRRKFLEFIGTLLTIFSVFLSQIVSKCKGSLKKLGFGQKFSIWKSYFFLPDTKIFKNLVSRY